ncbi:MAG: tetratricopeptide repeat protein [Cyanobacteria bacterium]|nr:tetratricopeptide repeat protein [Cyanobacteriota bacterium]MDA1020127.1 tetratricopeptide repeat protein [Cyanobacteriota bacterium]
MQKTLASSLKKSIKLLNSAKIPEAIDYLKQVIKRHPQSTDPLKLLAEIYMKDTGEMEKAQEYLEKSLSIETNDVISYFYLGLCLEKAKKLDQAFEAYKKAHFLSPQDGPILHCIARILNQTKHHAASIFYGKKALEYLPNEPMLYTDLAYMCHGLGMSTEAYGYYKKAIELEPDNKTSYSGSIFVAHKVPGISHQDLMQLAQGYNQKFIQNKKQDLCFDHTNRYDKGKKQFKLGFVSADFKRHPAAYTLISVFEKLDKSKFELNLYYNNVDEDFMTEKFKKIANQFTFIKELNNEALAQKINDDQIDILFDLSGFTSGERLAAIAYKPAPLQITHVGYFGTLGIPEIDFVIADEISIQKSEEQFYTERVYKMPHCYTHCKQDGVPQANKEAPCIKNGYITFGSFNTFHKISKLVLLTWIELLKAIPNSKLLFDSRSMLQASDLDFFRNFFIERGISIDRIILRSNIERNDFLNSYNDVDIALDPFPLSGSSTTLEALLMGVPVVTLAGDKWSGRMSSSLLNTIGHHELIANSIEEYKSKLIELAQNPSRIQEYRTNLNQEMQESPLNINQYLVAFEQAMLDMWQLKCNSQG